MGVGWWAGLELGIGPNWDDLDPDADDYDHPQWARGRGAPGPAYLRLL